MLLLLLLLPLSVRRLLERLAGERLVLVLLRRRRSLLDRLPEPREDLRFPLEYRLRLFLRGEVLSLRLRYFLTGDLEFLFSRRRGEPLEDLLPEDLLRLLLLSRAFLSLDFRP